MSNCRRTILVSAYACEPGLGSEIGVGWHWVLEMSKYFDLWVLTRKSNQENIERWIKTHPTDHKIQFIYYDLPRKLRFWKKGLRGVRLYYLLWQHLTNRIVKETMYENRIEIYHLLTYGNALWPASRFGQKKFFIWGPVGVGDIIPAEYSKHYGIKSRLIELIRRLSVKTLPINRGFIRRCRDAKLIFCKTETTLNQIPKPYQYKALVFSDVAVEMKVNQGPPPTGGTTDNTIRYLAVGRLDAWRGFDLLIEAFNIAQKRNNNIRLEILGMGSDKSRLETLISKHSLQDYVKLDGRVPMETYYRKMAICDVVVNPSLKEGAVTVAFDSMSFGKPLICIDTGGYTRYFNNDYAVVIPRTSRQEVIEFLAKGIIQMTDHDERKMKGIRAQLAGKKLDWNHKGENIYQEITQRYSKCLTY
ncbi:MAG: glycosyltransferase [Bacteroidales bacterium]|nr:glycosyltransferase [Bacteroidales bacterium]